MLNSVPNNEDILERFLHKKRDIVPIIRIFFQLNTDWPSVLSAFLVISRRVPVCTFIAPVSMLM